MQIRSRGPPGARKFSSRLPGWPGARPPHGPAAGCSGWVGNVMKDGKLIVDPEQGDDIDLMPIANDWFAGSFAPFLQGSFRFQRRAGGRITTLLVTTFSVCDLRFDRHGTEREVLTPRERV